jgi:hypothetical protein
VARSPARQLVALHYRYATTLEGNATSFLVRREVDRCFDLGRFPGAAPGTCLGCLTRETSVSRMPSDHQVGYVLMPSP